MDSKENSNSLASEDNIVREPLLRLFKRLDEEITEKKPANVIYFIVDFLCKHYPQHLAGFASIWHANPEFEFDRRQVIEFFRYYKIPTEIACQFIKAGFDTLETICSINTDSLAEIQTFNEALWLPGHKVRLTQLFSDISNKVRQFRHELEKRMHLQRFNSGICDHPTVITRTNIPNPVPANLLLKCPEPLNFSNRANLTNSDLIFPLTHIKPKNI